VLLPAAAVAVTSFRTDWEDRCCPRSEDVIDFALNAAFTICAAVPRNIVAELGNGAVASPARRSLARGSGKVQFSNKDDARATGKEAFGQRRFSLRDPAGKWINIVQQLV